MAAHNVVLKHTSWDAVGAIVELATAIGVIASLVYLAKQINANTDNVARNTRALVSDRDVSSNESVLAIIEPQIRDPELAALTLKGNSGVEPLTDLERYRCSLVVSSMFKRGFQMTPDLQSKSFCCGHVAAAA